MELKDFVKVYDNVLDKEVLNKFMRAKDFFMHAEPGRIGAGSLSDYRKVSCHSAFPPTDPNRHYTKTETHWNNFFVHLFKKGVEEYMKELQVDPALLIINEMVYLKYKKQDHYGFHVDQGQNMNRQVTTLFMVNDDYIGGNLIVTDPKTNKEHIVIKPQAGRLIIFPSNFMFPHKVEEVLSGERFIIVSWWN